MARLTRERNLRTGRSLWTFSPGLGVPVRPLTEAIAVDVAVVGAGVSGALMARELARDHTVAVLDRRAPLMGSTIASTALIQWEIDRSLVDLGRRIGPARARRAYARSYAGVAALGQIVAEERIRCGLQPRATLYVAGDLYGARALQEEAAARAELGLPSRFVAAEELRERFAVPRTGAILSEGSACADPGRLTAGLLRRAIDHGARVYSPVEVVEAIGDPEGVTLTTTAGPAVRARAVVFCCGYEFPKCVPTDGAKVMSTWALASRPRTRCPEWLKRTLVWEASSPYLYVRTTPDGRVVAGGEDEDGPTAHADPERLRRKCAQVVAALGELLPALTLTVEHRWAGAFGTSASGLPRIAAVPGLPHAWAVMGFGGNGITYSRIASEIVAAAIRGERDPDADLFEA